MSMTIAITGAAGFIGSQLAIRLHREGHRLILIDDLSYGYEDNLRVDGPPLPGLVKLDIRSPDLAAEVQGADCLFHLAGLSALPVNQSEPDRAISVNVAGTANVLEAARRGGVERVVFASTSAVYENNTSFPCREDDQVNPTLIYALSKWQAERLCASYAATYGMAIATTRYYNVYGPHQDIRRLSPPFVGYVTRELLQGRAPVLHSDGRQERDYVFLDDVIDLNIACMQHPAAPGQIFNVASGVSASVNMIFDSIAHLVGTDIKAEFRPSNRFWDKYPALFQGPYPMRASTLDHEVNKFTLGATEKATTILDWTAKVALVDGLRQTVDHTRYLLRQ